MTDTPPSSTIEVNKDFLAQKLRYLREVWNEPSITHVINRLATAAYLAAPSKVMLERERAGIRMRSIVIHYHVRDMLRQLQAEWNLSSAAKTVNRILAEADHVMPCRECVFAALRTSQSTGRSEVVVCKWTPEQTEAWNRLRRSNLARNPTGNTNAGAMEVLIVDAWVATFQPEHKHRIGLQ